jgi:HK97 family phage major capsid protein
MNLKEILAKKAADLTAEEKAFLQQHWKELSPEQQQEFNEAAPDDGADTDDDNVDGEAVKALIANEVAKQVDSIADGIAEKFVAGVATQRAKAIDTGVKPVDEHRDVTKTFMKALFANDTATLKALTTSTSDTPKAGYLVPTELANEVLRIAETQYGLARREMRYLPFSGPGNTRTIPALGTSVSVYWTNEGAAKSSTQPGFSLVTQTLKKLAAIVPFTDEILEDSQINLTQLVSELFAEAVAKEEDLQFFNGTGSPWTGVMNTSGINSVVQLDGGTTPTPTVEDLQAMIDATPSGALNGAKFYMHRTILSKLRLLRENGDGTGAFIFTPAAQGNPPQLLGYPVETSDALPSFSAATAASKPYVLFANLKQAAIFGDKRQLQVKVLDQATITDTDGSTDINLAEQDMTALRVVERVGYVVALKTAITVLKTEAS